MKRTQFLGIAAFCAWILVLGTQSVFGQGVQELKATKTLELRPEVESDRAPVLSVVALDPAAKLLATVGDDHLLRVWSLETNKVLFSLVGHYDWVKTAVFSPDSKMIATAGDDRTIRFWAVDPNSQSQVIYRSAFEIRTLAYSPDGKTLAAAGFGNKIILIDVEKRQVIREADAPGLDIFCVVYSPDGSHFVAAGQGGKVRFYRADGTAERDVAVSKRTLRTLAYSPDGKKLAAGGLDQIIRVVDASSGEIVATMPRQPSIVFSLTYCKEDLLASGGSDNVIRVWDTAKKAETYRLTGHTGTVSTLTFRPLRGELISGSFDTTARVWQIAAEASVSMRPKR